MGDDKPQPEDFDNPDVLNAVNPHPNWGYVHGPIRNRNPAWVLPARRGYPTRRRNTRSNLMNLLLNPPDQPLNLFTRYNGLICDVQIDEGQMCGLTFTRLDSFEIHMNNLHPACCVPYGLVRPNEEASRAAENAMKRWIITGGWRDASYRYEPGRCQPQSPIGRMCDELEEIAANNPTFAKKWGTRFHRWHTGTLYKNRAVEPPPNPVDHKDNAPSAEVNHTAAVTKRIEVIDLTD